MGDTNDGTSTSNHGDGDHKSTAASNKRTLNNDDAHNQQSNKRRKKNNGKKKKGKTSQRGNQRNNKHKKQNTNWIENCSDSIDRVPSNCAAPLTCVITRVEIEEEPLLPKGVRGEGETDGDGGTSASAEVCITGDENEDGDDTQSSSMHKHQVASASEDTGPSEKDTLNDIPNIAKPSASFVSQYAKEKVPWKMPSTVEVDNKEKKLFIAVKRHASSKGPTKWVQNKKKGGKQQSFNFCHLPGGDNGDGILNPHKSVPDKFWAQRKRLFSRYDQGIQIGGEADPEMWYSVTPESIADHVAERMVNMICKGQSRRSDANPSCGGEDNKETDTSCGKPIVILDVFCGCGGNTIAFARLRNLLEKQGKIMPRVQVIAVDNNLPRLKMAANNAAIYEVDRDAIVFIHADAVEVLNHYSKGASERKEDTSKQEEPVKRNNLSGFALGGIESLPDNLEGIFLSPPWGGMDYGKQEGGKSGFDPVTSITVESSLEDTVQGDTKNGTIVKTNGGELLSIATKAILCDSKEEGMIAYFLPRNTDGICLGQIAVASGIDGSFEMEQNVVNGKVKTITAYFGHGAGERL